MLHFSQAKLLIFFPKNKFFSKQLLIALGIAATLHLFALVFIHVPLTEDNVSTFLFAPIQVEVVEKPTQVASHQSSPLSQLLSAPPKSNLQVAKNPRPLSTLKKIPIHNANTSYPLFSSLLTPPIPTLHVTPSPLKLHILPRHSLEGFQILPLNIELPEEELLLTYSVHLDNETGIIFFASATEPYSKKLATWAQNLLREIRFEPRPGTIISGKIDLSIIRENND